MSDASAKPTADKFIAIFDDLFRLLGEDAFGLIELALLHSGPATRLTKIQPDFRNRSNLWHSLDKEA